MEELPALSCLGASRCCLRRDYLRIMPTNSRDSFALTLAVAERLPAISGRQEYAGSSHWDVHPRLQDPAGIYCF